MRIFFRDAQKRQLRPFHSLWYNKLRCMIKIKCRLERAIARVTLRKGIIESVSCLNPDEQTAQSSSLEIAHNYAAKCFFRFGVSESYRASLGLRFTLQHRLKRDFQSPTSILKMNQMEVYQTFCSADNFFIIFFPRYCLRSC